VSRAHAAICGSAVVSVGEISVLRQAAGNGLENRVKLGENATVGREVVETREDASRRGSRD